MKVVTVSRLRLVSGLLLVALISMLMAACAADSTDSGSSGSDSTGSTPPEAKGSDEAGSAQSPAGGTQGVSTELDAKSFIATEIGGGPAIVAGSTIMLSFVDGHISVNAGCNTMVGEVTLTDGTVTIGPLASTMMACDTPLMDQDAWLTQFLESGPKWTLEGDVLKLDSGTQSLTLEAA